MFESLFSTIKHDWFSNIKNDLLAGIVVALALIPEAITFSIIAGVDPKMGLYASFCIAVVIAFVGGRSGMISAATGAMALLMITLVKDHGLEYLLAATLLTGAFQIIAGFLKLGSLMRFVSRSVVTGFVNALVAADTPENAQQLPQATEILTQHDHEASSHLVQGQILEELERFQAQHQIGLTVMGAYGHSRPGIFCRQQHNKNGSQQPDSTIAIEVNCY